MCSEICMSCNAAAYHNLKILGECKKLTEATSASSGRFKLITNGKEMFLLGIESYS